MIVTSNMFSATFNGFLFPTLRDKLEEKLHHVTLTYSVQSLQAQKNCEISCKEGMLHAAIYLQLIARQVAGKIGLFQKISNPPPRL